MPVAMELRRLGQESYKFNASLGNRADPVKPLTVSPIRKVQHSHILVSVLWLFRWKKERT